MNPGAYTRFLRKAPNQKSHVVRSRDLAGCSMNHLCASSNPWSSHKYFQNFSDNNTVTRNTILLVILRSSETAIEIWHHFSEFMIQLPLLNKTWIINKLKSWYVVFIILSAKTKHTFISVERWDYFKKYRPPSWLQEKYLLRRWKDHLRYFDFLYFCTSVIKNGLLRSV